MKVDVRVSAAAAAAAASVLLSCSVAAAAVAATVEMRYGRSQPSDASATTSGSGPKLYQLFCQKQGSERTLFSRHDTMTTCAMGILRQSRFPVSKKLFFKTFKGSARRAEIRTARKMWNDPVSCHAVWHGLFEAIELC